MIRIENKEKKIVYSVTCDACKKAKKEFTYDKTIFKKKTVQVSLYNIKALLAKNKWSAKRKFFANGQEFFRFYCPTCTRKTIK